MKAFSFTTYLLITVAICVVLSVALFKIWEDPYLSLATVIPSAAFVWIYDYSAGEPNPDGTRSSPYKGGLFAIAFAMCFIVPIAMLAILSLIK